MAVRLFSLRHVPEDEADDVRRLLDEHGIDFYETAASGWGVSVPAIWLYSETRFNEAKALIDRYQQQRANHAQKRYQQLSDSCCQQTVFDKLKQQPIHFILFTTMILFVLYVSLSPFLSFLE